MKSVINAHFVTKTTLPVPVFTLRKTKRF